MKNNQILSSLMQFYIQAEKLKTTMRHSWTSNSVRQESSAEHSWMLTLIALTIFDQLTIPVDRMRILKILIVHDLAEAITGDIPAFDTMGRVHKIENEKKSLWSITENLPAKTRNEIRSLFLEYEDKKTIEAKVSQAIDKFESPLQHNIADISTWDQNDYDIHGLYKMEYFNFEPFLKELRLELENMTRRKVSEAGQLHRFRPDIQEYYNKLDKDEKQQ